MSDSTFDLLTLALAPGVTPRAASALLALRPLADSLARPPRELTLVLGEEAARALGSGTARRAAEAELDRARASRIEIVGRDDESYPLWLRRTHTPPLVLWIRGDLVADEGERAVGVVGCRAATPAGRSFAERLAEELVEAGLVVVSGLARGIDAAAHRGALGARGRTVAVLGSGLDLVYPPEHEGLAERIAATGALVSEFPLGCRPWKSNFPRRNRVIAGWARALVVVEAGSRSGALSTARAALDEGRDVMAVPGHPLEPQAEGANALLRDGAALVRGAPDVLAELGVSAQATRAAEPGDPVLCALANRLPVHVEELQARSGLPLPELLARLSELELRGEVERQAGGLFAWARPATGYTR
jgi:DNA processing protein